MTVSNLRYDTPGDLDAGRIPVIDFAPFLSGTAEQREAVASLVRSACQEIGFFYIVNHGVPESLREAVLSEARTFFEKPVRQKLESSPKRDDQWCGYLPGGRPSEGVKPGGSFGDKSAVLESPRGTIEQYSMSLVHFSDDPLFEETHPLHQKNIWPLDQPSFVETMIINQRALLQLGHALNQAFALALGVDENTFIEHHTSPVAKFGLNYYPNPKVLTEPDDVGIGAHCDTSTFTILLQDNIGGLEVRTADGRWVRAPYVEGAYIVNIGDTMMAWTNGKFVSTLHRVVSRRLVDRYSATMFMSPNAETVVAPLPELVTQESPALYKPFHVGDQMERFFKGFYARSR